MNHYDAMEIVRRHHAGQPIGYGSYDEAKEYLACDRKAAPVQAARALAVCWLTAQTVALGHWVLPVRRLRAVH